MLRLRDRRLLLVVAAALFAALWTGGAVPWFLFWCAALVLGLGLGWAWWLRRELRAYLVLETRDLDVGQELRARFRLDNEALVPMAWAEVDLEPPRRHLEPASPLGYMVRVDPYGSRFLEFRLRARRRGHFRVGPVRVRTGDGLGVCRVEREVSGQTVTVYPRVVRLPNLPLPLGQPFGHVRVRLRAFADPASLAELRPWRPGDSLRHVHWATTARRGELYLKEFEFHATTHVALFLDLAESAHTAGDGGDTLEYAIEACAALGGLAVRRGFSLRLAAHGAERYRVAQGPGARTFRALLAALAAAEPGPAPPLEQLLPRELSGLPARSVLAVVTPRLSEALAALLAAIHRTCPVLLICPRAETFGPLPPGAPPPERQDELARLLAAHGVDVYRPPAGWDLADLPATAVPPTAPPAAAMAPAAAPPATAAPPAAAMAPSTAATPATAVSPAPPAGAAEGGGAP